MRLVAALVLLAYSIMGSGQTVTSVKLVKLVADPANPKMNDIFVAMDVQNDQNVPITVSNGQFVLFDTHGKTYETSDFGDVAHRLASSVVVALVVDAQGTPQQVHVVQTFGRGSTKKQLRR